ncbi:MAG TPA: hypothetical protein HPP94_03570 [Desulfuromonadales bacterium]|nr:hypothetical protein [Desulfuromonadales bacterium]
MLCFARNPEKFFPNARLDTTVTITMQAFYGDVFYLIKKAEEYIQEHINIGMRLDGLFRSAGQRSVRGIVTELCVTSFLCENHMVSAKLQTTLPFSPDSHHAP